MQSSESGLPSLESQILQKLRPFQREAFEFATQGTLYARQVATHPSEPQNAVVSLDRTLLGKGKILLADEMGLGKTVTSLAIMSHYENEWNPFLLIICPASLRHVWPAEIERFFPSLSPQSVHICQGFSDIQWKKNTKILVVTFSLLQERSAVAHKLQQLDIKCVIVDESHHLKQKDSQRTKTLLPILSRANRVALLSGTPALAKPVELWTQLHVLAPKLFGTWSQFVNLYCNPRRKQVGRNRSIWDYSGATNMQELNAKLQNVMVRRLKSSVLNELPPKQRSLVPVSMEGSVSKEQCLEAMEALNSTDAFDNPTAADNDFGSHQLAVMKAYQMTGIGKAQAVANYLLDWLEGSGQEKVLVFCHHKAVMDVIDKAIMNRYPNAHIRIDGGTQNSIRGQLVNRFQTCDRVRVGLLSMTAAGVGLTLTAASTVIFAELHWTPGILAQAEDRVHRIGQKHSSVQIIYMICKDKRYSLDTTLWRMLGRKIGTIDAVMDGKTDRPYLFAAQEKEEFRSTPMSGQSELIHFFAEASADETARLKRAPVKGSIMSFFQKASDAVPGNPREGDEKVSARPAPTRTSTMTGKRNAEESDLVEVQSSSSLVTNVTGKTVARSARNADIGASKNRKSAPPMKQRLTEGTNNNPSSESETGWVCGHCTFENLQKDQRNCLVCGNLRGTVSLLLSSSERVTSGVQHSSINESSDHIVHQTEMTQTNATAISISVSKTSRRPERARMDDGDSDSDLEDFFYQPINLQTRNTLADVAPSLRTVRTSEPFPALGLASVEPATVILACETCTFENIVPFNCNSIVCEMCMQPIDGKAGKRGAQGVRSGMASQPFPRAALLLPDPNDCSEHRQNAKRVSLDNEVIVLDGSPLKPRKEIIAVDLSNDDDSDSESYRVAKTDRRVNQTKDSKQQSPVFSFSVSRNTGRVTAHWFRTGESLQVNFDLKDILSDETADRLMDGRVKQASQGTKVLSLIFDRQGLEGVRRKVSEATDMSMKYLVSFEAEVQSFALSYLKLRETEKKALQERGQPVQGEGLAQFVAGLVATPFASTDRYVGGARERAAERHKEGQASKQDQAVLDRVACAWCGAHLEQATRRSGGIYCSQACGEEGRLRRGGQFGSRNLRAAVFALEAGKCTICGIDAHSLFEQVCALDPPLRLNKLMSVKWNLPKSRNALESLLRDPKEGDFWQVDHIVAVSEGGGGCGLENLRTLCVPCHEKETADLRRRLRLRSPTSNKDDGAVEGRAKQSNLNQYFAAKAKPSL